MNLVEKLKDLKKSKHRAWKMSGYYTFQRNCVISDCSPSISITPREFNRIIKALESEKK